MKICFNVEDWKKSIINTLKEWFKYFAITVEPIDFNGLFTYLLVAATIIIVYNNDVILEEWQSEFSTCRQIF